MRFKTLTRAKNETVCIIAVECRPRQLLPQYGGGKQSQFFARVSVVIRTPYVRRVRALLAVSRVKVVSVGVQNRVLIKNESGVALLCFLPSCAIAELLGPGRHKSSSHVDVAHDKRLFFAKAYENMEWCMARREQPFAAVSEARTATHRRILPCLTGASGLQRVAGRENIKLTAPGSPFSSCCVVVLFLTTRHSRLFVSCKQLNTPTTTNPQAVSELLAYLASEKNKGSKIDRDDVEDLEEAGRSVLQGIDDFLALAPREDVLMVAKNTADQARAQAAKPKSTGVPAAVAAGGGRELEGAVVGEGAFVAGAWVGK